MTDLFSYAEGTRRRDAGMAQAAARDPRWNERAYAVILDLARRQGELHVDDVLLAFSDTPPHPNSWGAVWMRAVRNGVIEKTEKRRRTADLRKHSHEYPIYRSLVNPAS